MKRAICWGVGSVLLVGCGRAASSPPHGTSPGTGAVTTVVPTESDARVSRVEAPFDPEAGAYSHQHDEMGHGGKIHDRHQR